MCVQGLLLFKRNAKIIVQICSRTKGSRNHWTQSRIYFHLSDRELLLVKIYCWLKCLLVSAYPLFTKQNEKGSMKTASGSIYQVMEVTRKISYRSIIHWTLVSEVLQRITTNSRHPIHLPLHRHIWTMYNVLTQMVSLCCWQNWRCMLRKG